MDGEVGGGVGRGGGRKRTTPQRAGRGFINGNLSLVIRGLEGII